MEETELVEIDLEALSEAEIAALSGIVLTTLSALESEGYQLRTERDRDFLRIWQR